VVSIPTRRTKMFRNVLVGVDGRPNGRDAIALARNLIGDDGKLTLAHVHGGELRPTRAGAKGMVRGEREASEKLLEAERAAADVSAELISVAAASPGRGLHLQAEDQGADLIVVGSCSHGALGRVMLGDDTRAALNGAPCAVAIATAGYAEHPVPFARVGVAYDGSPESEAALTVAGQLAAPTRATVHALEVIPIQTYAYTGLVPPDIGESIDAVLSEADNRMKQLPGVEGEVSYGLIGEELAAFGDRVDILVVGSRGYGPMKRLMVGSTSDYLQRHARCSLVVLPRTGAGQPAGEGAADEHVADESPATTTAG
jgi:nucleotide-binding universal stress UspA family protein